MKQRNVLLVIQPAYPERIQGIARFARSHGWHLTIVDRLARFPRGWRGDGALLSAALKEIAKRIPTPFGVAEVAEALKVPRTRLDRLFAEKFSRSVGKEIVRQHTERAKRLLASTDKPIKEIAALCGYCNAGYFTNAFRTESGLTPKTWRRGR